MYKSTCIEEAKFEKNMYSWNDEDYDSEYQLDKGGVEKYFNTDEEVIIIALKIFIEYRERSNIKKKSNYIVPCFWENMSVWLFMMKMLRRGSLLIMKNFNLIKSVDGI